MGEIEIAARPGRTPRLRAAAMPSLVRSTTTPRSKWAEAAMTRDAKNRAPDCDRRFTAP